MLPTQHCALTHTRALPHSRTRPRPLQRAAAYINMKRYSSALKDLDDAVSVDASFTQGYLTRGKLHRCGGPCRCCTRAASCLQQRLRRGALASSRQRRCAAAAQAPCLHACRPAACCPARTHRKVCSLTKAKSDFEAVLKLRPTHSQAPKELDTLGSLGRDLEQLEALQAEAEAAGGPPAPGAATELLARVYKVAPDCIPAQLLEAQLEMRAGNFEQVRIPWGGGCWVGRPPCCLPLLPACVLSTARQMALPLHEPQAAAAAAATPVTAASEPHPPSELR